MNQTPKEVLETILGKLGFFVEIEEELREGHLILQIRTNEPQRLIGRRDETLESLQFLVNRILLSQNNEAPRVIVDVEHHRSMRDAAFLQRIQQLADAVKIHGRPVETEPLNSYDRRLVHNAYRDDAELMTESQKVEDKIKRITIRRRLETPNIGV
ncbi:MAG: single-stranded DNA-binding protein [Chthoniobacterales bacterium]|jgi:spoIIIJ-associated protein|nr:single-stranded DNA-binding protein [Chthoniobacterales bacterium]